MKHVLTVLLICLAAAITSGGSLYVDDNAAGDPGPGNPLVGDPAEDGTQAHPYDAIQQAINAAANGDEVIILPGTYTGDGNRDIDFKGKPITVRGTDPNDPNVVAATVIDCQGTEAQPHRGFHFHTNETQNSVLKGLTITNGYGAKFKLYSFRNTLFSVGGGVFCKESSPKLDRVVITQSVAEVGGAILATDSNIQLLSCRLINNAGDGGGGYFYRGSPVLDECLISDNQANYNGGGLLFEEGNPTITECRIASNTAPRGGGLFCVGTFPSLLNCEISANVADSEGGGIYLRSLPWGVEFRNCLFSGNYSRSHGGGIYVIGSAPVISECTIVGNRAEKNGGGIFGGAWADIKLRNSIIRENMARLDGNQISFRLEPGEDPDGRRFAWQYCAYEGPLSAEPTNIRIDPLFADPGYWEDNGTPDDWSDDTWIEGDYHLKSWAGRWEPVGENWVMDDVHSPCIDAGDPEADYSAEPAYNGNRINIGAYANTEYASRTGYCPEHPIGDLDGDCKVTFADLAMLAGSWMDCNLEPPIACE